MLGKIFEDNPGVMLQSLQAIKELPSDTLIFPGKEKHYSTCTFSKRRGEERWRKSEIAEERFCLISTR